MKIASQTVGAIADRRSSSLTRIVQREVERMIVSGDLAAGQRINEQHLASRLGVSRGPVREALRALERTGLVQSIANLGTFVRKVGIEEACEMYEMRGVVFGFACARLAGRATEAQKTALSGLVAEMDAAIAAGDSSEYYRLNLRFHDLVMEFAAHKRASEMHEALVRESHLFRQRSLLPVASMRESNAEHAAIVAAVAAGDAAAARQTAERHHLGGKTRWLITLSPRDAQADARDREAAEEEGARRRFRPDWRERTKGGRR
jgi:DNA-binding GntR family transcriptional regulator